MGNVLNGLFTAIGRMARAELTSLAGIVNIVTLTLIGLIILGRELSWQDVAVIFIARMNHQTIPAPSTTPWWETLIFVFIFATVAIICIERLRVFNMNRRTGSARRNGLP